MARRTGNGTLQCEVRLGVWPGFVLPALDDVVKGAGTNGTVEQQLEAVFFDTPDLRLLRRGVTVRFRRGETERDLWTVNLPRDAQAIDPEHLEISVAGDVRSIPPLVAALARGWALGAPIDAVARLRTMRRRTTLFDGEQKPLAVLDDDEVSILRGNRVAARFRELDVELVDGAPPDLLAALGKRLRSAGAQPLGEVSKVARALGPAALAEPELTAPDTGKAPTAAQIVRAGLLAGATRLVDHHAAVVLDDDTEGVHQARVGTRRLRSDLRTFEPLLDPGAARSLRRELGWLGNELGAVRDLDVLLARLTKDGERLRRQSSAIGVDGVLTRLAAQRAAALDQLLAALASPRYAALLERTAAFAHAPPFASKKAQRPAAKIAPALVRGPLRKLRKEVNALGDEPADAALHRVRIHVKRTRYATELVAPLGGKPPRRAARALADLQDLLGTHADAVGAVERLRDLVPGDNHDDAWAAGALASVQLERAARSRARFDAAWRAASRKRRWAWLD